MKTNYLFPNYFKKGSGALFVISFSIRANLYINKDQEVIQLPLNVFAAIF
jgi:hypothetical protein